MIAKKTFWGSVFGLKCPRCRKGNLFLKGRLFQYTQTLEMPEHCSVCNQKYDIESGFWIGAMWISYPFIVILETPFLFLALFAEGLMTWIYFAGMVTAFVIFMPMILRLGRSLWIHISIRNDKSF